jgi:hypothetical protein
LLDKVIFDRFRILIGATFKTVEERHSTLPIAYSRCGGGGGCLDRWSSSARWRLTSKMPHCASARPRAQRQQKPGERDNVILPSIVHRIRPRKRALARNALQFASPDTVQNLEQ